MRSYPSILIVSSFARCVSTRQMTEGYFSAVISASEFTFDFSPLMLTYSILKVCNALYIFFLIFLFSLFLFLLIVSYSFLSLFLLVAHWTELFLYFHLSLFFFL